ncbi:MAG TPA: hypothetical protein VJB91_01330 [Patescibacteria group bacterium]|nr:hypothetical protein [Patescibacteria group bacterium]
MGEKGSGRSSSEKASREFLWGIPTRSSVEDHTYMEVVSLQKDIQEYEDHIDRFCFDLPNEKIRTLSQRILHLGVEELRTPIIFTCSEELDLSHPISKDVKKNRNQGKGFTRYTYEWIPYDFLLRTVSLLEEEKNFSGTSRQRESFFQIHRHSLQSELLYERMREMEEDEASEAGRLWTQHVDLADASDMYVDWGEESLVLRTKEDGKMHEKGYALSFFQDEKIDHLLSLCQRIQVRDILRERIAKKEKIVVNGVNIVSKEGKDRYYSDGDVQPWVVDLLCKDVVIGKTKIRVPSDFAKVEEDVVRKYQKTPLEELVSINNGVTVVYVPDYTTRPILTVYEPVGIDKHQNLLELMLRYVHPQGRKLNQSSFETSLVQELKIK